MKLSTVVILGLVYIVKGDWGDYVDPTFNCPAETTCPVVCVADANLCPTSCPNTSESLCADGTCAETCDPGLESPCAAECASVACAKVVDYFDNCQEIYGVYYADATKCAEEEEAATTKMYSFTEPGFLFFYCWMGAVFVAIFLWCFNNQKMNPVPRKDLIPVAGATETWIQTAYKVDIVGMILFVCVVATFFLLEGLLLFLVISYYVQQEAITRWQPAFPDEEQSLLAFIIVWCVTALWMCVMKFPHSISALFLRRCHFSNATHIAVFAPTQSSDTFQAHDPGYIRCLKAFVSGVSTCFRSMFSFFFSDKSRMGEVKYCKILRDGDTRHFYFRLRRYNYDAETDSFVAGQCVLPNTGFSTEGLTGEEVEIRNRLVGPNVIRMAEPNALYTVLTEFTGPFYIYQSMLIWAWSPLWYYYMALVYIVVVGVSGIAVGLSKYFNAKMLYQLTHITGEMRVIRDGEIITVQQKELVPGDIVFIERGIAQCDMIILKHTNIVVDESALTGESTPVSKTAFPQDEKAPYDALSHKKHTIFAGTTVLESSSSDQDLAMVTKTASFTSKGEMLRDILSYERHTFKFDTEVKMVCMILLCYGIVGFAIVVKLIKDSFVFSFFYAFYVFATALPPLLPTVFVVSVDISGRRLLKKLITCANPQSILVAGKVKKALFDKTGTLTKQGLDFLSCRSVVQWNSDSIEVHLKVLSTAMSTCHCLAQSGEGLLLGNQVDRKMFEASGATISKVEGSSVFIKDVNGNELHVLKRYEFDHHRMTQSVIVKTSDGKYLVIVKGSAESIEACCDSVPKDFQTQVKQSAREGIYQISVAQKELSKNYEDLTRDDLEMNLTFIGVLNFKNLIREETEGVINQLEAGDIKSVMVTGDNVYTGIHIAREAGMIKKADQVYTAMNVGEGQVSWMNEQDTLVNLPEDLKRDRIVLAMHARVWNFLLENNKEHALNLLEHTTVIGRCSPSDKISVVTSFNEQGYITSMVGDGGNDCGALKTAHVGIALSDSEASIVAPFTSINKCITSIVEVIREGRCALASSFASYKYMIMYGQVETINQIANAYFQVTFAEFCWVFMDGIWLISMAFSLPYSKAEKQLAPERPTSSLLGPYTMASTLGVLALNFIFTVIGLSTLSHQDWYQCRKWGSTDVSNVLVIGDNYEAEVLFLVTGYQYISSAMTYNFGYSFRGPWIKNYVLVAFALCYTTLHFYITLVPSWLSCAFRVNCTNDDVKPTMMSYLTNGGEAMSINNAFNTTVMPYAFRWTLIGIMIGNTAAIMCYEYFIVNKLGNYFRKTRVISYGTNHSMMVEETNEMSPIE